MAPVLAPPVLGAPSSQTPSTQKAVWQFIKARTGRTDKANAYASLIVKKAQKYRIPLMLVARLIAVESNFDPRLVSSAGARGLMQVMPFHFKSHGYGPDAWKNPTINLDLGCKLYAGYRERMRRQYPGLSREAIEHRTLVAYNMGPRAVTSRGITRSRYSRTVISGKLIDPRKEPNR